MSLVAMSTVLSPASGTSDPAAAGTSLDTVYGPWALEAMAGNSALWPVIYSMPTGAPSVGNTSRVSVLNHVASLYHSYTVKAGPSL